MIDTPRDKEHASVAPEADGKDRKGGDQPPGTAPGSDSGPVLHLPDLSGRIDSNGSEETGRKGYTMLLWLVVALLTGAIVFVVYHVLTAPPRYAMEETREPVRAARTLPGQERTASEAHAPAQVPTAAPAPTAGAKAAGDASPATNIRPSFDVIRVEKDGSFVAAGKAEQGSELRFYLDEILFGTTMADARGEWVFAPDTPMKPGDHLFQAEIVLPDKTVLVAAEALLIFVPLPGEDAEVLVLSQPDDSRIPVRVLQGPEPGSKPGELGIVSLDSDTSGHLVVRGTGGADQKIRLYLDNEYRGQVTVGTDGRWAITLDAVLSGGRHTLRVDRLSEDAHRVEARVETGFEPPALPSDAGDRVVIVRPGNNLWNLARQVYGTGWRYTVIFDANRDQIRDPDLIYPGQKLRVPPSEAAGKDP